MNTRQQKILLYVLQNPESSSSAIFDGLNKESSLITIKRDLKELVDIQLLISEGAGRSVVYSINSNEQFHLPLNAHEYTSIEIDDRMGNKGFDFDFFEKIPEHLFFSEEYATLHTSKDEYIKQSKGISEVLHKKELERFVIELSWKSSQIEGNTYSLLDTQLLIEEGIRAEGHSDEEAMMILNHKRAFTFIIENKELFKNKFSVSTIEKVHSLLVGDLNVKTGLRERAVGITGSTYTPLDNIHQIKEALDNLVVKLYETESEFDKSLLALVSISYIQPFDDGNKRTARLFANAFLIANDIQPLSYRNVDVKSYKENILTFYETLSIIAMKKMFIEQIIFSGENYKGISGN